MWGNFYNFLRIIISTLEKFRLWIMLVFRSSRPSVFSPPAPAEGGEVVHRVSRDVQVPIGHHVFPASDGVL